MRSFSSVTEWQASDYLVRVRVEGFASAELAAAFGNSAALSLRFEGSELLLVDQSGCGRVLLDHQVSLSRLSQAADARKILTAADYEPVRLAIESFGTVPALAAGFGSLSFGVLDADGSPVPIQDLSVQPAAQAEDESAHPERLQYIRDYFESGCLCLLSGGLAAAGDTLSDSDAVAYYERSCRCSRNYTKPIDTEQT